MAIGFTTLLLPGTHCVSNHGSLVCSQNSTGSSAKHGCCTANMLCLKMMHYFTPKMWQIYLGKWWTAAGLQGISVFPRKFSNKPTPTTQHKTKDLVANSGVIQVGTGLGQQVATALPQMHASCSSFEKSRARKVGKWPEKRKKHVQTLRNIHEKPKYFHHSIKRNPYIINVCIIYHYIYIYTFFPHCEQSVDASNTKKPPWTKASAKSAASQVTERIRIGWFTKRFAYGTIFSLYTIQICTIFLKFQCMGNPEFGRIRHAFGWLISRLLLTF